MKNKIMILLFLSSTPFVQLIEPFRVEVTKKMNLVKELVSNIIN